VDSRYQQALLLTTRKQPIVVLEERGFQLQGQGERKVGANSGEGEGVSQQTFE
jgi:hypothetical protein